ncbi:precorrin-3B C(17)-methyltransferase [uncultured Rhodoblastus sp.]|uniref:precorrin-3B C(17)-methyltransferase n=1 Tax=uncultured Rhodoblastus sp. TaxID=543037 RepID=UPI0025DAA9C1|nr:precorrin-3B C(17)-methyltransferase [uncultured Rhodoblastus sp.]
MTGQLFIIGLGPGPDCWLVPEARDALAQADALIGYQPYTDRVPARAGLERFSSDNRVELDRARHALELAQTGRTVAVVSGGDAGVFGMAAAIFEAVENGDPAWRALDIRVVPGISAAMAAAARLGAPLGHDFCVMSLSDNLKPWEVVAKRLAAAAQADFVIALYNPASKARPRQIFDAFDLLRAHREGATPVAFARAIGRPDERILVTDLAQADPGLVDMATLVLIGSSETRFIARPNSDPWLLTPRTYGAGR